MAQNTAGQTLVQNISQGTPAFAVGKDTLDATSITTTDYIEIVCGFKPKYVKFENATDCITGEFYEGMADNSCLKTAQNGAKTLEVTGGNGGITLTNTGFRVLQNATLGLIAASKVCYWQARA